MNDRECNNVFRFSLYQENVLLGEKMFDADQFNPFTRYSIDIRDILPRAITRFQKVLSKKNYDVFAEVGRVNMNIENSLNAGYDLLEYNQNLLDSYPDYIKNDMEYNPKSITHQIDDKVIRGVECKLGLYINNNPIVERVFFVDGYNPIAKLSVDIIDAVVEITDVISEKIKKIDKKNMWDDYDLINLKGMSINQIRELKFHERERLLRNIRFN
jgi:hypothetical protein